MAAFNDWPQPDSDDEAELTPASSGVSGPLTELPDFPTQKLVPLDRFREMRQSRGLMQDRHEQWARALRQDAADVQRTLYETAERAGAIYSQWVMLRATMEPQLEQIAAMRALNAQLVQALHMMDALRTRYERQIVQAESHEHAMYTLRQAPATVRLPDLPWGGDAS